MSQPAGARLNLAEELIDVGRFADAERIIDAELAAAPDSAAALCARARLLSRTGDYEGMHTAATRAAEHEPAWEYPHRLVSIAARMLDRPRVALAAADAAVAAAPNDPLTHHVRAQALIARGRYVEAYEVAERARALAPADPESFHVLAEVFQAAGDLDAARRMYHEALRLAPDAVSSRGGLAYLRWISGRDAAAARAYREVLASAPTDVYLRRALQTALTFMQFRWVTVGVAGVVAVGLMQRAGVGRPVRLATAVVILAGTLAGVWWAHRGLGPSVRSHLRASLRTYGPLAPAPAGAVTAAVIGVLATAPGPLPPWFVQTIRAVVFLLALIPVGLLLGEVAGGVTRWHRRRVLRRAIRAGSGER